MMKVILAAIAISTFFSAVEASANNVNVCSSRCINTSGNSAYDELCRISGGFGQCGDYPNVCSLITRPAVKRCVNISGNPAYDNYCQISGQFGNCEQNGNVCRTELTCQQ